MLNLLKGLVIIDLFDFDTRLLDYDVSEEQLLTYLIMRGCAQVYENE